MKWGWLLILGGLYGSYVGATKVYRRIAYSKPTKMTCAEYYRHPTADKWLELADCRFDLAGTLTLGKDAKVKAFYIPVIPKDSSGTPAYRVLVKVEDTALENVVRRLVGASAEQARALLLDNAKLNEPRVVDGWVASFDDATDKITDSNRKKLGLHDDVIILSRKEMERGEILFPAIFGPFCLLSGIGLVVWRRRTS
ncbi:MAG: hypothetical protein KC609_11635 [Myxococcales bacterium]|nr:hypothetical protein [Myxococcales bacterium]